MSLAPTKDDWKHLQAEAEALTARFAEAMAGLANHVHDAVMANAARRI